MKKQRRVWFLLLLFFLIPLDQIQAFDTYVIHPKLAGVIASLFNEHYSEYALNENEIDWLAQGTIEEDEPISRAFNHFYNPLTRQGLKIAGIHMGLPSPEWSFNSVKQRLTEGGDCSWQTAVNAYKNNDIAKGIRCLGHTLHLLEDVGVPAHTRNDQHAFEDPFEEWGKYSNPAVIFESNGFVPNCQKADDCIIELATWVNSNFFSKDTINSKNFPSPMNRATREDVYLMDSSRKLAAYNPKNKSYFLSQEIQYVYWLEISPKIIAYGLRLLEIFYTEVGVLKQNRVMEENNPVPVPSNEVVPQVNQQTLPLPTTTSANSQVSSPRRQSVPVIPKTTAEIPKKQIVVPSVPAIPSPTPSLPNQPPVQNSSKVPETYILTRPAASTNQTTATFVFSSDIPEASFECSGNSRNWQSCSSYHQIMNLAEGKHDIFVRAITETGSDQTPIHYSWTVDTTPPITALISDVGYDKRSATFRFYSEIGAHFECKLDGSAWTECQSPRQYTDLSAGNHFFQVRASDKVGNKEVIASGYTWQIVINKPEAPIIIFPSSSPFYTNSSIIEIKATTEENTKLLINGSEENIEKQGTVWVSEQSLSNNDNVFTLTSQNSYEEISDATTITVIKDAITPSAIIENLAESYNQLQFTVQWRGFDSNSDNLRYDVQYRLAEVEWQSWQDMTTELQAEFTAPYLGPPISFRVRARDQAGNISDWSEVATTHYSFNPISHVVISQVITNGPQGSLDEFIELYNPSSAYVNLQGYTLQKKAQIGISWLDSTATDAFDGITIPPYGYILVSGRDYGYQTISDLRITNELAFDENGHIRIINSAGEEIDRLGYGSASNPEGLAAPSPIQSISLQRKAYYSSTAHSLQTNPLEGNGYDSDYNLFDFVLQNVVIPRASHNQALMSGNVEAGLLYLWHFDECNGQTYDSLNLSSTYQTSTWSVGRYGCGMYQSWQTNQEINWNLPTPITSGELTLSFYRKEIVGPSASTLWFLNSQRTAGIGTKVSPHGINPLFNNQEIVSGISPPPAGTWYHYTIVYSNNYLAIYIDGVLKKKIIGDYSLNQIITTVAIDEDSHPYKFDEIAVWNRAVSSEEIITSLGRQLSPHMLRPAQTAAQTVHYWNFDNQGNGIDLIGGREIVNPEIIPGRLGNGLHITWQRQLANTPISTITNKDVSLSYWRKRGLTGNGGGAVAISNQQTGRHFGMGGGYGESYYYFNESVDGLGCYIPADNNWHHIALVYDSYLYHLRYYIDGILQTTREQVWLWDSFNSLVIGEQQYSFILDDLKIWDGALTNQQVAEEAN